MSSFVRKTLAVAVLGVAAAGGMTWAAVADDSPATATATATAAADDRPAFAVEDFAYPGAAAVKAEHGIELGRGDGHIVLADCDPNADQISVLTVKDTSAGREGTYCFRATASSGYLTMELPRVFALETAGHPISADLTAAGTTTTVEVGEDDFKSVGEGTAGGAQSVLVEIRVTG